MQSSSLNFPCSNQGDSKAPIKPCAVLNRLIGDWPSVINVDFSPRDCNSLTYKDKCIIKINHKIFTSFHLKFLYGVPISQEWMQKYQQKYFQCQIGIKRTKLNKFCLQERAGTARTSAAVSSNTYMITVANLLQLASTCLAR